MEREIFIPFWVMAVGLTLFLLIMVPMFRVGMKQEKRFWEAYRKDKEGMEDRS